MDTKNNRMYTYTIEKQQNNIQKITIQFNKEELENLYNQEANTLKSKVPIKGFRPGKVPDHLLRRIFYDDFIKSKVMEMINDIAKEVLKNENLKPLKDIMALYKKEDVDNFIGNNYKIEIEVPTLPDFSSLNLEEITIKRERHKVTDEEVEAFIEVEELRHSAIRTPKQNGVSEEHNVLEVGFNLYETESSETASNNKPLISQDSSFILLSDGFIKYFCETELNGYKIEKKDLLGLEKGTFKRMVGAKIEDNIIKKAYVDLWVKNILSIDKDRAMEQMLKLWNVSDINLLKNSIRNFLKELEEFEAKIRMFRVLLDIIIKEYKIDINYPPLVEKMIAETYLRDFTYAATAEGIPRNIIEKRLQEFSITDKNFLRFKLEMLLFNYFLDTTVKPSKEELLKTYSLIERTPYYALIKGELAENSALFKFLTDKFSEFKTIDKILAKIKIEEIEEEDTTSPITKSH